MKKYVCSGALILAVLSGNGQNVGIGTNNPQAKLHIAAPGFNNTLLLEDTSGAKTYLSGASFTSFFQTPWVGTFSNHGFGLVTNRTYRINILNDGRVGIGTIAPVSLLANSYLGVIGSDSIGPAASAITWIAYESGYAQVLYNNSLAPSASGLAIKTRTAESTTHLLDLSTGSTVAKGTPVMVVLGDGRVGIGTSNPISWLTNTTKNMIGSDELGINPQSLSWVMDGNGYAQALYSSSELYGGGLAIKIANNTSNRNILDLSTGRRQDSAGSSVLVVRGDGRVGINQPNPKQKLDVKGNIVLNDSVLVLRAGIDFNHFLAYSSAVDGPRLNGFSGGVLSTNGGNALYWNANGKIAIGNINPQHQLNIGEVTSDVPVINVRSYSSGIQWKGAGAFGYTASSVILGELNGVATIGGHNSTLSAWADLAINTGGGNLGVGTANPSEKLTVNGALKISNGGYANIVNNSILPVPTGGAGTIVYSGAHFFGWDGTLWKQLDN